MSNLLSTLVHYKAWADEVFYAAVAGIPAPELVAPRPILFGNIIRTLNHVHTMDKVWQAHLMGVPHGHLTRNPLKHPPFETLRRLQAEIDAWYMSYSQTLSAAKSAEVVEFEFIGGGTGAMSRGEILLHVVNHATYHRGHVADMLYHVDTFPPATDLPVFLRECTLRFPTGAGG